jgi:hypothetical protein
MRILPQATLPADEPIIRRHAPPSAPYATYRQCLRWEFGFTCAFCLLHESDLIEHGVEGTGLTSIEHLDRQETEPGRANVYENCYYACRFCNGARGRTDRIEDGRALLDPCADAWGAHFDLVDDELRPRTENAVFTHDTYRTNAARKKQLRRDRRRQITEALETLRETPPLLHALMERASTTSGPESLESLNMATALRTHLKNASQQLKRFAAVPADQRAYSYSVVDAAMLSSFLSSQLLDSAA